MKKVEPGGIKMLSPPFILLTSKWIRKQPLVVISAQRMMMVFSAQLLSKVPLLI